jgi:1,4-alpha-glucan branching enzyme
MQAATGEEGCPCFQATVQLDDSQIGSTFRWAVLADTPGGANRSVIVTEVADPNAADRWRQFTLNGPNQQEHYWFATCRRFGAQRVYPAGQADPAIRFSVWAPLAQRVDVVLARFDAVNFASGYIDDAGDGVEIVFPLFAQGDGTWSTDLAASPELADYSAFFERLYMFRIVNEQGQVTYKTDLWSRDQIGRGMTNPGGRPYSGTYQDLDGTVSCSVVADPDQVTSDFSDTGWPKHSLIPAAQFWQSEFQHNRPLPQRIEDLIVYELHVGSLGYGRTDSGNFADAIALIGYLVDLGVNAVELMPVLEYDGNRQWGYGTSHFFCLQSSAGGGNELKFFVRECHRNGLAVIMDVVYNHFLTSDSERSEWGYDSDPAQAPEHNLYYWYEGLPSDYASPDGGYLDNGSSGWAPRYSEENVRQMFTSSAAALLSEYHVDGLRVDLTGAIHQDNALHADGRSIGVANQWGIKLLRELSRTVHMVNPSAFLIAEDYTGWAAMTQPVGDNGIGFDAVWYADFYHHLIGDGNYGSSYARLLKEAGYGTNDPLAMDYFAGALADSQYAKVVYHESHDEAGNETNTERTIVTAVNGAALTGATRQYAESRARVCYGLSVLSAGTPMFLMGEEIGAAKYFRTSDFYENKEDLAGERTGDGRFLFRYYQDLNRLVRQHPALRSRMLDVLHVHNANRVIAFHRTDEVEHMLVAASFNNQPFGNGYYVPAPDGWWQEIFNSDSAMYGGNNVGNGGATLPANNAINLVIPANGLVVFQKVG